MKTTIWFSVNDTTIKGINLGTVESFETEDSVTFTRIIYAQNRLIYLTTVIEKENPSTLLTTNVEIISNYVVLPELDKILNSKDL